MIAAIAAAVQVRCGKADMISGPGQERPPCWSRMFRHSSADACGEVEYTLETSREIDAIMRDFFAGRLLALAPGCGRDRIQASAGGLDGMRGEAVIMLKYAQKLAKMAHSLSAKVLASTSEEVYADSVFARVFIISGSAEGYDTPSSRMGVRAQFDF